jgi:hypothetical protein
MAQRQDLTLEERARITEIQDLLIEHFVERREAIENGQEARARELEAEIENLQREREGVETWATASR